MYHNTYLYNMIHICIICTYNILTYVFYADFAHLSEYYFTMSNIFMHKC